MIERRTFLAGGAVLAVEVALSMPEELGGRMRRDAKKWGGIGGIGIATQ
jgi:hypothetical protein